PRLLPPWVDETETRTQSQNCIRREGCGIDAGLRLLSITVVALIVVTCAAPAAVCAQSVARTLTAGDAIFQAGCAGCHGPHGEGAPPSVIGFDKPATFPDFTDCPSTTPGLDVDWKATSTNGGGGR